MKIPSVEEKSSHGLEHHIDFSTLLYYLDNPDIESLSNSKFENSSITFSVLNPYCLIPLTTLASCEISSTGIHFFLIPP
jgi:hypothetical protein